MMSNIGSETAMGAGRGSPNGPEGIGRSNFERELDGLREGLDSLRADFAGMTERISRLAGEGGAAVRGQASKGVDSVSHAVGERPLIYVAAAVAVGTALGLLLSTHPMRNHHGDGSFPS